MLVCGRNRYEHSVQLLINDQKILYYLLLLILTFSVSPSRKPHRQKTLRSSYDKFPPELTTLGGSS